MNPEQMLQLTLAQAGVRLDANETAHLQRQLEFIKTQTYDIQFGLLKSRQFIPVDNSADPGAESITYRQWSEVEMAKVIANMADDLPLVDVNVAEFTAPVKSLGSAYQWSVQDLRRAAMAGSQLDSRRSRACRMSIERAIDNVGAFGVAGTAATGMLNNANVPVTVLPNPGAWTGLTPANIIANLNAMAQAIVTSTLEVFTPDTILLDTVSFGHIAQTPIAVDNQTTILRSFLANNPYIRNIDQWTLLNTAGAGGIHRSVTYFRDPLVLQFNIPQEFEQFPPQARNLSFVVPCHARVGGVEIHYPLAMSYSDIAL
jgi:hypothetical protein